MPHGGWVAFDGPNSVHQCGQKSEYGGEQNASGQRQSNRGRRRTQAQSVSKAELTAQRKAREEFIAAFEAQLHQQSMSPKKKERRLLGWVWDLIASLPGWVWWLIAIIVLFLLKK